MPRRQFDIDFRHGFSTPETACELALCIFQLGVRKSILVSIGQRITDDNGSAPEDRIATVFDVIEQILNVRARR